MASWYRYFQPLEKLESHILLNLKALYNSTMENGNFIEFPQNPVMQVTEELHALLKVSLKTHLELQAVFINIQQYKPA